MRVVRYFFGLLFLSIGLIGIFKQPILGLVLISWGVLLLPFANRSITKTGWRLTPIRQDYIIFIGILLAILSMSRSQEILPVNQQAESASSANLTAKSRVNPEKPSQVIPKSNAQIKRKGLDFSYELDGKVQETKNSIIVDYARTWQCSSIASSSTANQQWQFTFDLHSGTWTSKVKEISSCIGIADQEWNEWGDSTTFNPFTITQTGKEVVIKADSRDVDGSLLVKDAITVSYLSENNLLARSQVADSASKLSSQSSPKSQGKRIKNLVENVHQREAYWR